MILGIPLGDLVELTRAHLLLSFSAVMVAIVVGLPLAAVAANNRKLRGPLLAVVNFVQTIPGLALLALFYPMLLLLADATGLAIPALGFLPALLALSVYALLPIVRNGVTALCEIDPTLSEAANALGMTKGQKLRLVELPLGAPVLLAGIRIASVWTIGTATLATTIGQPCLGDLIFSGLQTQNWQRVLAGCIAAATLALLVDLLLGLAERGFKERSKRKWGLGIGLIGALLAAALIGFSDRAANGAGAGTERTIVIGAKGFSEQYILAELIQRPLDAAGYRTERRDNLGSAVAYEAVASGDIDAYVDYSGTLWTNLLRREDTPPAKEMLATLREELANRDGVVMVGGLGFENAYAFAMRRDHARRLGVATLSDLSREAPDLRFATDLEFLSRPEWEAVRSTYDLRFRGMRAYSPTFMYSAIEDGSADVISAFSSDGRIAALDLATLSDPRQALPSYDAVLLLSPQAASDPELLDIFEDFVGSIPIEKMREANWMVDREADKRSPAEAAAWLEGEISLQR